MLAGASLKPLVKPLARRAARSGRLKAPEKALPIFATLPTCCSSDPWRGIKTMRQVAAVLLLCALFEVLLLAGPALEANAQGYDVSGQAVVHPLSVTGTPS